ncbi:MAG: adenosylcobinamide-GDP ribazoletransferase [Pseudomonadota bacterium]
MSGDPGKPGAGALTEPRANDPQSGPSREGAPLQNARKSTRPDTGTLRRCKEEFLLAYTLLTRLPAPVFTVRTSAKLATALWAFPLVGTVLGAGIAAVLVGLTPLFGAVSAAFAACTAGVMGTGALHEDGLADFCDGVGGARARERKLEIMRDSRIGTYGVLALVLSVGMTVAGLVELATSVDGIVAAAGMANSAGAPLRAGACVAMLLVLITAGSRLAVTVVLAALEPARDDGLARMLDGIAPGTCARAWGPFLPISVVAIAVMAAVLPWPVGLVLGSACALAVVLAVLGAGCVMTRLARTYLGGYTGDVLGAAIAISFVSALLACVAVARIAPTFWL